MARLRWRPDVMDPFQEVDRLRDEINRLFESESLPMVRGLFDRPSAPPIDLTEEPEQYTVMADVPGLRREDIEITLAQGVLTIKGEKKTERPAENARRYREESWHGRFQRTVALPGEVDPTKVGADLTDGVLTITLPKREDARPRQISIQAR